MIGNQDQAVNWKVLAIWTELEAACKGSETKLKRIKNVSLAHIIYIFTELDDYRESIQNPQTLIGKITKFKNPNPIFG